MIAFKEAPLDSEEEYGCHQNHKENGKIQEILTRQKLKYKMLILIAEIVAIFKTALIYPHSLYFLSYSGCKLQSTIAITAAFESLKWHRDFNCGCIKQHLSAINSAM